MLVQDKTDSGFDLARWSKLAHSGTTNAIAGFSKMINQEITITALNLEEVLARNIPTLIGKADDRIVGIYLSFSGNTAGHIILAFQPGTAYELVDMVMGQPIGSTQVMGEMERSVIGEVGNVVGAFFLNTIADSAGQRLLPSPPLVSIGTVGSIFSSVMADVLKQNKPIFAIRLSFSTPARESTPAGEIEGRFLVLPTFS